MIFPRQLRAVETFEFHKAEAVSGSVTIVTPGLPGRMGTNQWQLLSDAPVPSSASLGINEFRRTVLPSFGGTASSTKLVKGLCGSSPALGLVPHFFVYSNPCSLMP